MAPADKPDHNLVEQQIKDIIQDLFQVLVQVSTYDTAGRPSQNILAAELTTLSQSLAAVHRTASTTPYQSPSIPELLINYVEKGRNPDIYTREFVELVRRMNQLSKGKQMAFSGFRDVLAREMSSAMPEVEGDVRRVVEATGGGGLGGEGVRGGNGGQGT